LRDLIETWTLQQLNALDDSLQALENKLLGSLQLDKFINDYMTTLQSSGILDSINDLNKFEICINR
jgi:hypothetical protein